MRRSLRFVRALALASTAGAIGCDGGALLFPDATTTAEDDSRTDATVAQDATLDVADVQAGSCRVVALDATRDLECGVGFACSFPDDSDVPRCTYGVDAAGDAAENQECGTITCAEYCYCVGPAVSVCGCFHGPTGPLSPPDLPRYETRSDVHALSAIRPRDRLRLRRRRLRV